MRESFVFYASFYKAIEELDEKIEINTDNQSVCYLHYRFLTNLKKIQQIRAP